MRKYEFTRTDVIEKWAKNYPKVITWLSKLQRKEDSAWILWLFCKTMGKNPDELLALKDDPTSREAEYLLDNFVADEKLDIPNATKVQVSIAVKSFFAYNYRDLARKSGQIFMIKQKPYRKHTKEELLKVYRAAYNPRDRAMVTFTWSTAIARESLVKLQWLHLEKDWEKQELPHIGLPDKLTKGHGIGKYKGVEQHTFLTPEAKRDLIEYREYLERKGAKITPETNIWISAEEPLTPLSYSALSKIAWELSKRSGVPVSWHDARRYVETALEEIRINPNWARKIRGRKVRGEEAPYSRPAIEQLREKFREAVPLLEFTQPTQLMELQKRQQIVEQLTSKFMSGEQLTEEDRANIKRYNIQLRQRAHRQDGGQPCEDGEHCGESFEQITETQLLSFLKDGWQIVHRLGSGDLIVKRG